MLVFLYVSNLAFGLIFGILAYNILTKATQDSIEFEKLIGTFDFTVITDFLRNGGEELAFLVPVSALLSVLYLLLNVFFSGGILKEFENSDSFDFKIFFQNSSKFFYPFLLLFFIVIGFVVLILVVGLVLYFIFTIIADGSTEQGYFLWLTIPTSLIAIFLIFILQSSDYAKNIFVQNQPISIWRAFVEANRYIFQNPKTYRIYWVMILASIVLLWIYSIFNSLIGMASGFTIFLMILIQQFYILGRIFIKTWFLQTSFSYLQNNPAQITRPSEIIETEEENKLSDQE